MGGTNPKELKNLGAPNNDNLQTFPGLHAKVYLSEAGGVVCSANASNNGVGFLGETPNLLEAGIFVDAQTRTLQDACKWFEKIWGDKNSSKVDHTLLHFASVTWAARARKPIKSSNFISRAAEGTESDNAWGFVFTNTALTKKDTEEARKRNNDEKCELDYYSDFGEQDIKRWPLQFYDVHLSKGKISVGARNSLGRGTPPKRLKSIVLASIVEKPKLELSDSDRSIANEIFERLEPQHALLFSTAAELRKHLREIRKLPS